jgi:hypothetical protein
MHFTQICKQVWGRSEMPAKLWSGKTGKPRYRWEDNFKMDRIEIVWKGVE